MNMKLLSKLALTFIFLEFKTAVSAECKEWCDDTPIPPIDENGGTQYCDFTDLCDGCEVCQGDVLYVAACGSTLGACKEEAVKFEPKDAKHEVRCCSDTQLPNWQKKGNCPWATSFSGNCVTETTFSGAENKCTSAGGRLCTAEELLTDCTKGTGCQYDHQHIWSSSVATDFAGEVRTLVCGKFGRCPTETKESYAFVKNEVRCCAETPINQFKKNPGCTVWGGSKIPECKHAETYDSAVEICGQLGARLCTIAELQDDCTAGTGCNHDNDFVWSLLE